MGRRWRRRPFANHRLRADDCRRHPRVWIEIGSYNGSQSARRTARCIRLADELTHYAPAGAFEAKSRTVNGEYRVYARYVGAPR
ncbi:hypothetical protein ACIGBL_33490 [Streptomyces sp. NPDC085614]|uniref:hypothetical protein n=1 Tax=Streptomyces sp. NPDC085614 TaxID=3365733 RepID=UPI0037D0108D